MSHTTLMTWMRRDPDPEDYDEEEDDDREPIDLAGLEEICKGHKFGAALLAVGIGLIARGHYIYLVSLEQQHGSIMIGYWYQGDREGSVPEWFPCTLRTDDFIEASVSTTLPEPYLAFFQQDVGDSEVTYFDEPIRSTGGTVVRFHMLASDQAAPDLILRFYDGSRP